MSDYYGKATLEDWLAEEVFNVSTLSSEIVKLFEKWRTEIEFNIQSWMETDDGDGNHTSWRGWGRGFSTIPDNETNEFNKCVKRVKYIIGGGHNKAWGDYMIVHKYMGYDDETLQTDSHKRKYGCEPWDDYNYKSRFVKDWNATMDLVRPCASQIEDIINNNDMCSCVKEEGLKVMLFRYLLNGDIRGVYGTCIEMIKIIGENKYG